VVGSARHALRCRQCYKIGKGKGKTRHDLKWHLSILHVLNATAYIHSRRLWCQDHNICLYLCQVLPPEIVGGGSCLLSFSLCFYRSLSGLAMLTLLMLNHRLRASTAFLFVSFFFLCDSLSSQAAILTEFSSANCVARSRSATSRKGLTTFPISATLQVRSILSVALQ
jgi:hypothetical protein